MTMTNGTESNTDVMDRLYDQIEQGYELAALVTGIDAIVQRSSNRDIDDELQMIMRLTRLVAERINAMTVAIDECHVGLSNGLRKLA